MSFRGRRLRAVLANSRCGTRLASNCMFLFFESKDPDRTEAASARQGALAPSFMIDHHRRRLGAPKLCRSCRWAWPAPPRSISATRRSRHWPPSSPKLKALNHRPSLDARPSRCKSRECATLSFLYNWVSMVCSMCIRLHSRPFSVIQHISVIFCAPSPKYMKL